MADVKQAPLLLQFLFGEAAEAAQQGASKRLRRWAEAFEGWLDERRGHFTRSTHKQAALAWHRLLGQQRKAPWELTAEDVAQHTAWMGAEGYSPTTIANTIGIISNFYQWCDERKVDPACEAGFNPASGVQRPKVTRYAGATLLSRGEAQALLDLLQRDATPLGKRDYAFILARLRTGVPLSSLQRLQWGQIEQDEGGTWVRWRPERERSRLPEEAWEAMRAALAAGGRLAGMEAGKYVFAPLAEPGREGAGSQAGDWAEERCLSTSQILADLKLYGRLAGIGEGKLTLMTLRRTATRLMLEEGGGLEKVKSFLDSQEEKRFTKYRLKRLPELPGEEEKGGEAQEGEAEARLPNRKARPFRPGEGMTHGLYARSQPPEGVAAMLAENIQGLEAEIVGMRTLARGCWSSRGRPGPARRQPGWGMLIPTSHHNWQR